MAQIKESFAVPWRDKVVDQMGMLSYRWQWFFNSLFERLYPLGVERSFDIANNQAAAADVTGLKFDKRGVSQAIIEFLVQRVTTGAGAVELIESGILIVTYNPTSEDWNLQAVSANTPDNSGVDFTITSSGQVQYTSSNETGTASISKLFYRSRTLAGKNTQYSATGGR